MEKPKVLIIYTGGTIGMVNDLNTGMLTAFNFDHLYQQIPELKRLHVDLKTISFEKPVDSSEMNPLYWKEIANIIYSNYTNHDGFVVLHGSDTMAYTASALSFMLQNLSKPIIFTGSQLPIDEIRTDGKENVLTSIEIAAARKKDGTSRIQEVAIYFENNLDLSNINNITFDLVEISPNPFQDKINITVNQLGTNNIIVYNTIGKKINTSQFEKYISIDARNYPSGTYILQIETNDNKKIIKKIIKS